MKTTTYDQLRVDIFDTLAQLAASASDELVGVLQEEIAARGEAAVIFATGNSQLAFYQRLRERDDIAWDRITVFHMDEYMGLADQHPASFRRYMREHLIDAVHPRAFYPIEGDASDLAAESERYTRLIAAHRPVACVMGIGENGHLAFNDPPADFATTQTMQVVNLVDSCRLQQVGEGHFASLDDVPQQALTLTIPALLAPPHILVIAPEARKAAAVRSALCGPISPDCPASILRSTPQARLLLDNASAALL